MVRVASLCRARGDDNCGPLTHLERARRGDTSLADAYEAVLPSSIEKLVGGLEGDFDAILSPPSDHPYATRYRDAFLERYADADDLTQYVTRAADAAQSGAAGTTLLDVIAGLRATPLPSHPRAASLLIVDDIFEGGKTVAALLHVLREAGLRTRAVTVACVIRRFGVR